MRPDSGACRSGLPEAVEVAVLIDGDHLFTVGQYELSFRGLAGLEVADLAAQIGSP